MIHQNHSLMEVLGKMILFSSIYTIYHDLISNTGSSQEDYEARKELWEAIDVNGNGFLSLAEVTKVLIYCCDSIYPLYQNFQSCLSSTFILIVSPFCVLFGPSLKIEIRASEM